LFKNIHQVSNENLFFLLKEEFSIQENFSNEFMKVIPQMIQEIIHLDQFFKEKLFIINHPKQNEGLTLTKLQIRVILACSFFGLLMDQREIYSEWKQEFVPIVNFASILRGREIAKLQCLMNYFIRIYSFDKEELMKKVSYTKIVVDKKFDWENSKTPSMPGKLTVHPDKTTIEECDGCTLTDFANEFIGGLIYRGGCVQEEIAFLIKPECLVSMIFFTRMNDNESIHMRGIERFSSYSGYANSFKFEKDFQDKIETDDEGFKKKEMIAIDAVPFSFFGSQTIQFEKQYIDRELIKAYCGFFDSTGNMNPIASGNWGCGMFGGNIYLKSVIQLLAAGEQKRDFVYCSFGQEEFSENLKKLHDSLSKKTVGEVYKKLISYEKHIREVDLFTFLQE
jgi:poly(ADP-ribose) glycohydrolase